jgi:hypothetical protein
MFVPIPQRCPQKRYGQLNLVISIVQDQNQHHVQQGLRILVQHLPNAESLLTTIRTKLQNRPPVLCLFEYGRRSKTSTIAVVDKVHAPNKIFVNIRLAEALEAASASHWSGRMLHLPTDLYN